MIWEKGDLLFCFLFKQAHFLCPILCYSFIFEIQRYIFKPSLGAPMAMKIYIYMYMINVW
jgi:hypothetical protein